MGGNFPLLWWCRYSWRELTQVGVTEIEDLAQSWKLKKGVSSINPQRGFLDLWLSMSI